jgi:hypothetical protein
MWGTAGTRRRRRLIRAEFVIGVVGCIGLGVLALATGSGWMPLIGIWLVGIGLNYVPLAIYAQRLSRPGALEAEVGDVDVRRELRRVGAQSLWIAVPFVVAVAAIRTARA